MTDARKSVIKGSTDCQTGDTSVVQPLMERREDAAKDCDSVVSRKERMK